MATAHLEAGYRPMCLVSQGAEMAVDIGNHIFRYGMDVAVACSGIVPYERFLRQLQRLSRLLSRVTVRHHHNHRLRFSLLKQVIQNLTSASHIAPGILIATRT